MKWIKRLDVFFSPTDDVHELRRFQLRTRYTDRMTARLRQLSARAQATRCSKALAEVLAELRSARSH